MMNDTNNLAREFPDGPITKQPVSQLPWGKPTIDLLLSIAEIEAELARDLPNDPESQP